MRIENESETAARLARTKSMQKKSQSSASLPQRPGFGTQGREVMLWTNYFELVSNGGLLLHRYNIEVLPDQAGRRPTGKKVKRIIELLLEEYLAQHGYNIATDFKSTIISRIELDVDQDGYSLRYRAEHEDDPAPNARLYQIRLQATGTLTVSELIDYLTSTQAGSLFGSKDEIIQALNIVIGHHPKAASHIASIGANRHFDLTASVSERMSLGAGLQAIRGFFVSVRAATARVLVNVQVKHAAFYEDGPLDRIMAAHLRDNGQSKTRLANFLKKLSVDVTHIVRHNRAGHRVPRIKQIVGLVTREDGRGLQHPPIVADFGAGPKDVKFFLNGQAEGPVGKSKDPSGTGGKKGKKPAKAGPERPFQTGYISVYDFFRQSEYFICH